jgi:predicted SprT family Zn-dependent metalloprotease
MGKNTHKIGKDGWAENKTKITVQKEVKGDFAVNMLHERVKGMWNALPDNVRDSINNLIIKKSRSKARGKSQGGRWIDESKTVIMNLHFKKADIEHNFYHEIGHSKWHRLKESNPEKVQEFIKKQKEIGWAPTAYSQSYSLIKQKNQDTERKYVREMERRGLVIPNKARGILYRNRISSEDLYQNEIHSEINAYAMGALSPKYLTAPKEKIEELLNSYKEMWDLQ